MMNLFFKGDLMNYVKEYYEMLIHQCIESYKNKQYKQMRGEYLQLAMNHSLAEVLQLMYETGSDANELIDFVKHLKIGAEKL